ncbi:MAG: hypothetical protein LBR98_08600 [Syntrophomonadaceae bacterium]|jgi:hypothetical protein|nr:hypothetical protein [Syntrophomonadaceae bacterium]
MKTYRNWALYTIGFIAVILLIWGYLNYYIDPLWNFSHANGYNKIQAGFDERQQKTNFITHNDFNKRSLLLGSSRATYFNQYDFEGLDVYNYSVSNMIIDEYDAYIEYAKKMKGEDFDYIIIGLDFYGTNKNVTFNEFQEPDFYIRKTEPIWYPFTSLLSFDTARYAWQNYRNSKNGAAQNFFYDRSNIKTLLPETDDEATRARIYATVDKYRKDLYSHYEYNQVQEKLRQIKTHNPDSEFIIFTTPVEQSLFELMREEGLYPYYLRWLRDIVEVFGSVQHFMYLNSVTSEAGNFYDASHIYPHVATVVIHKLINVEDPDVPEDFGMLINSDNIESALKKLSP